MKTYNIQSFDWKIQAREIIRGDVFTPVATLVVADFGGSSLFDGGRSPSSRAPSLALSSAAPLNAGGVKQESGGVGRPVAGEGAGGTSTGSSCSGASQRIAVILTSPAAVGRELVFDVALFYSFGDDYDPLNPTAPYPHLPVRNFLLPHTTNTALYPSSFPLLTNGLKDYSPAMLVETCDGNDKDVVCERGGWVVGHKKTVKLLPQDTIRFVTPSNLSKRPLTVPGIRNGWIPKTPRVKPESFLLLASILSSLQLAGPTSLTDTTDPSSKLPTNQDQPQPSGSGGSEGTMFGQGGIGRGTGGGMSAREAAEAEAEAAAEEQAAFEWCCANPGDVIDGGGSGGNYGEILRWAQDVSLAA
ncbi:hypothetical protein BCR35DRAFT_309148 [Leucosporidium creatinivorum]|uniref:Uncharacterized protein n=1 Tax=Leucosporidium creatinivorum TaxID=106004 RepID=A0A1Y2DMK8_9BASI|nr:hypothetical protein BCR35DRAFT_309148 [Leucosporidium creatinivorum]